MQKEKEKKNDIKLSQINERQKPADSKSLGSPQIRQSQRNPQPNTS